MWWGVLDKGKCLQVNIQYFGDYKNTSNIYSDIKTSYLYKYNSKFLKHYQVPVYVVPITFGTTGNVILLIIIISNKDMRNITNMYILKLAISDIIYLTVYSSETCANRISDTWLDDDFVCTFLPFCRRLTVGLSVYSVAVFSSQRYRVTVFPSPRPCLFAAILASYCGYSLWRVDFGCIFRHSISFLKIPV